VPGICRETSRVSSLMCPFCVRALLTDSETVPRSVGSSTPRTARLRQSRLWLRLRLVVTRSGRRTGDRPDQLPAVLERDRRAASGAML
jgi:hypothetical protein